MNLRKNKAKRPRRRGNYTLHIEVTSKEGITKKKALALEKKIFDAINDLCLMGIVSKTCIIQHTRQYEPRHLRLSGVLNERI